MIATCSLTSFNEIEECEWAYLGKPSLCSKALYRQGRPRRNSAPSSSLKTKKRQTAKKLTPKLIRKTANLSGCAKPLCGPMSTYQ